jgi:putative flippase GtrA
MTAEHTDPNHLPADTARRFVWFAVLEAGAAGLVWGIALFTLLYDNWPKAILASLCATGLSLAAYFLAGRVVRSIG